MHKVSSAAPYCKTWQKLIFASSAGNILQLYDFIIFGFFFRNYFKKFFPS